MTIPGPGGAPPPTPGLPPGLLAEWVAAEDRLYPVVLVRPDIYERSVELVRKVADELGSCTAPAALAQAWHHAADIVFRVSSEQLLPLGDLDAGLVAGAAFALRYRELAWPAVRQDRLDRVRAAAEAGDTWVLVDQSGSIETAGVVPYTWVEMHVPTGAGLRQTIEADPETSAPRYRLEEVQLDPATGDPAAPEPSVGVEESFSERAEWSAAVEAKRRELEGRQ